MRCFRRYFATFMFIVAFESALANHIKNCSSNRIQEISRAGVKSIIRFDEKNAIELSKPAKNHNVSLWCESDTIVKRCILEHVTSEGKLNKACEYETSFPCPFKKIRHCENKFISFESTLENKCNFILNNLSIEGKHMQFL